MKIKVLLSQIGTGNAPTPVILEDINGLIDNGLVTFNYDGNGEYFAESNGLFIVGKTSINFPNQGSSNNQINSVKTTDSNENRIYFGTKETYFDYENNVFVNNFKDGLLFNSLFEIEVLNEPTYTNEQQSAIYEAKSILISQGLVDKANSF